MSEVASQEEPTTECSVCGHVPGPYPECDLCHGNQRFVAARSYTLTEERQGKTPPDDRYGAGGVGPKVVNLPGSSNPYGQPVAN